MNNNKSLSNGSNHSLPSGRAGGGGRHLILVAGGKGLRMGGDVPKQFLPIGGRPVLMRTMEAFVRALGEVGIVLVLPESQVEEWRRLCAEYQFTVPHRLALGGQERFHSVRNGLALVQEDQDGVVAVHDGVRPFVAEEVIRRCYEEAARSGAAVPVVPVVETVREVDDDPTPSPSAPNDPEAALPMSHTLDRSRLRLVQTPQAFRLGILRRAYRQPYQPGFTDDASVVEHMGERVALVPGNRENIKLTTPSDILYAESLCRTC